MAKLEGMAAIRDYVRRSDATVLKYVRELDFPAVKLGNIWVSDTKKIDNWFADQIDNSENGSPTSSRGSAPAKPTRKKTVSRKKASK